MFCLSSEALACHLVSRLLSVPRGCHLVFILSFEFEFIFLAPKDLKAGETVNQINGKGAQTRNPRDKRNSRKTWSKSGRHAKARGGRRLERHLRWQRRGVSARRQEIATSSCGAGKQDCSAEGKQDWKLTRSSRPLSGSMRLRSVSYSKIIFVVK